MDKKIIKWIDEKIKRTNRDIRLANYFNLWDEGRLSAFKQVRAKLLRKQK